MAQSHHRPLYPEYFATETAPKKQEAVADALRHGESTEKARAVGDQVKVFPVSAFGGHRNGKSIRPLKPFNLHEPLVWALQQTDGCLYTKAHRQAEEILAKPRWKVWRDYAGAIQAYQRLGDEYGIHQGPVYEKVQAAIAPLWAKRRRTMWLGGVCAILAALLLAPLADLVLAALADLGDLEVRCNKYVADANNRGKRCQGAMEAKPPDLTKLETLHQEGRKLQNAQPADRPQINQATRELTRQLDALAEKIEQVKKWITSAAEAIRSAEDALSDKSRDLSPLEEAAKKLEAVLEQASNLPQEKEKPVSELRDLILQEITRYKRFDRDYLELKNKLKGQTLEERRKSIR